MTIAKQILAYKRRTGLSYREIGLQCGLPEAHARGTVYRWASGRKRPSIDHYLALVQIGAISPPNTPKKSNSSKGL